MLKINKFVTMSPAQYEMVIEGMRNPMNSWDNSDSYKTHIEDAETLETADYEFFIGPNDLKRMTNLAHAGSDHAKYRRMMPVWVDITAPLYWWKEFETYRVGVAPNPSDIEMNSCSTMHKITEKEFELSDFSNENLNGEVVNTIFDIITILNYYREVYLKCDERLKRKDFVTWQDAIECKNDQKDCWWQIIQLLPSSYNQKRTIFLNYEVLANMYRARRNHKLDEWHVFCDWIESLPYAKDLILPKED